MTPDQQRLQPHGISLLPWGTLLLVLCALLGYLYPGAAPEGWVFDRTAIAQGEWWRLITGHWVHSDGWHALWNITALGLIGALSERTLGRRLPISLLTGTITVDAWLWWGSTGLEYYCGLSGILNSLLAAALLRLWQRSHHPLVALTGLTVLLKIALEISQGQALFTDTRWPSIPTAHAAGFLGGLFALIPRSDTLINPGAAKRATACKTARPRPNRIL